MSTATQSIVNKAWNFAHVLRDDGLSYMAYTEQITFLLFLKMADELTKPPYNRKPIVPPSLGWPSLLKSDGDELEAHYRHILEELGKKPGMLGEIFKKARPEIQNPATLKRLIVDLIDTEQWSSMQADVLEIKPLLESSSTVSAIVASEKCGLIRFTLWHSSVFSGDCFFRSISR